SLTAIADAKIDLTFVCAERHEEQLDALIDETPRQLRKFGVITDQHTDRAAIGIYRRDPVSSGDVPPVGFVGRRMNLRLLEDLAIAEEYISHVGDSTLLSHDRCRTADDIDVI